jgi:predicted dehydrogenase
MSKRLSIGIIGAGQLASSVHVPVIHALDGARVAWVADIAGERAARVGAAYSVPAITIRDSPEELPSADVVLLAAPFGARDPYYPALARRGCAVLVEKPFSRSVQHHQQIAGLFPPERLGVCFQRRSSAISSLVLAIMRELPFGKLKKVRSEMGGRGIVTAGRYTSDIRLAGGGQLFEVGVHDLDSMLFLTGASHVAVRRSSMILDGGLDVHTDATLELSTLFGVIEYELLVSSLVDTAGAIELQFESASLHFSLFSEAPPTVRTKGGRCLSVATADLYPKSAYQVFHQHWSAFLAALCEQVVNYTSVASCKLTTQALEDLYTKADVREVPE